MGELIDRFKGKVKQYWGRTTGDRSKQVKGKAEQFKGQAKRGYENVKRDIRGPGREETLPH